MKKPKLSGKRCSPLPDIYTLIDKTSISNQFVQREKQNPIEPEASRLFRFITERVTPETCIASFETY